jgi:hypothetical protein
VNSSLADAVLAREIMLPEYAAIYFRVLENFNLGHKGKRGNAANVARLYAVVEQALEFAFDLERGRPIAQLMKTGLKLH